MPKPPKPSTTTKPPEDASRRPPKSRRTRVAPEGRHGAAKTRRGDPLRPERIQLSPGSFVPGELDDYARYRPTEEEAAKLMADLRGWRRADDGRSLGRNYRFPAHAQAALFVSLVIGLAELAVYYPIIEMHGRRVCLRLVSPWRGRRLTMDVYVFASTLEDSVDRAQGLFHPLRDPEPEEGA